jgi:hypothetical protein
MAGLSLGIARSLAPRQDEPQLLERTQIK